MDDQMQGVFMKVLEKLMDMLDMSPDDVKDAADKMEANEVTEGEGGELSVSKNDPMMKDPDSMTSPETSPLKFAGKDGVPQRAGKMNESAAAEDAKDGGRDDDEEDEDGKKYGFAKLMPYQKYE